MESNYVPISVAAPVVNGAVFLSHCFSEQELSMYSLKNHSFLEFGGHHPLAALSPSTILHCKNCGVPHTPNAVHTYGVLTHTTLAGVYSTPLKQCDRTPKQGRCALHTS